MNSTTGEDYKKAYNTFIVSKFGYHTNNRYDHIPPQMHDGRSIYASFQSTPLWDQSHIENNRIKTNAEYRSFMINNATKLVKEQTYQFYNDMGYVKRFAE
jgi:hypothetical protein